MYCPNSRNHKPMLFLKLPFQVGAVVSETSSSLAECHMTRTSEMLSNRELLAYTVKRGTVF
jgi:hypothetical protein